jgi:hypothetical protein
LTPARGSTGYNKTAVIAGTTVGGAVFLAILYCIYWYYRRRQKFNITDALKGPPEGYHSGLNLDRSRGD